MVNRPDMIVAIGEPLDKSGQSRHIRVERARLSLTKDYVKKVTTPCGYIGQILALSLPVKHLYFAKEVLLA
jgi:hypothetical protein